MARNEFLGGKDFIGLGMVVGRLSKAVADVSENVGGRWYSQIMSPTIRRASERVKYTDAEAGLNIRRAIGFHENNPSWELSDHPRKDSGIPIRVTDSSQRDIWIRTGDVSKVTMPGKVGSGKLPVLSYALDRTSIHYVRNLATTDVSLMRLYYQFEHTGSGRRMRIKSHELKSPWIPEQERDILIPGRYFKYPDGPSELIRDPLILHIDAEVDNGSFLLKCEMPSALSTSVDPEGGGTTVSVSPVTAAQLVADDSHAQKILHDPDHPHRPVVLLSGDVGGRESTMGAEFADAFHREGFRNDVYAATGAQIIWREPGFGMRLGIERSSNSDESAWTRYRWQP